MVQARASHLCWTLHVIVSCECPGHSSRKCVIMVVAGRSRKLPQAHTATAPPLAYPAASFNLQRSSPEPTAPTQPAIHCQHAIQP